MKKAPHPGVAKSGQDGEAKDREICQPRQKPPSECPDRRICASQHRRAACERTADRVVSRQVRHGQKGRVCQPKEGDDGHNPIDQRKTAPVGG